MIFHGVDGFDVYNPTAPFHVAGCWYLAARVEMRDSERSRVLFLPGMVATMPLCSPICPSSSCRILLWRKLTGGCCLVALRWSMHLMGFLCAGVPGFTLVIR
ncbi:DUF1861 family protein [Kluyvera cryocrescens]|uniref:DUF1861 family protein n=1 Tax=Kluyvera cryocrescens TaxID=580 RepID=UPI003D7F1B31